MLETYTTLGFLSAVTSRIWLGCLVSGVVYRHPAVLVKTATTLDILCGGRAYFGVGAAWFEREAVGLGVPFPRPGVRFEHLEETLRLAHQMWSGTVAPFKGKHFQLKEALGRPLSLSRPRPPILIGGEGKRKTLRLVAQYADACNVFAYDAPARVRRKYDVLRRHCDQVGRDFDTIERTALGGLDPTSVPSEVKRLRAMARAGVQHYIFSLDGPRPMRDLEAIGREVVPALADA
jgi:alkanesulfonate monooxygenase SsuD/methylene tetrahydromethanopterin reductase-like flavin-dependent oxidoreductase (luciferase family)